jgi:hypothetical protein
MIGFARFLRDGAMLHRRDHALRDGILVRMKRRLFPIYEGNLGPERLSALVAAIPDMQRNALAGGRIHGYPDPLLVRFLLYKALHLVGFRFQASDHHRCGTGRALGMEVIGTGCQACDQKVQEPCETDTDSTAAPTECNTLAQQLCDALTPLGRHTPVQGISRALAATRFTRMILLPIAGVTIFLGPMRSTRGAGISDYHGCW